MARPIKDDADYFSHDKNMRNDDRIRALRKKFGYMGYALWCMLLERLTDSEGFKLRYQTNIDKDLLIGDLNTDGDDLDNVIQYAIELELFKLESGMLFSERLIKNFQPLINKRNRQRKELSTAITNSEGIIANDNTQYSIVKKSIVKESISSEKDFGLLPNDVEAKVVPLHPKGVPDDQFEKCWELQKRRGSKSKALIVWKKLSQLQRDEIEKAIPAYVSSVTETKFIKHFERWINPVDEYWKTTNEQVKPNKVNGISNAKFG